MSKIKATPALIKKAKEVFVKAGKQMVLTGEGLSRQELRALERKGMVEKIRTSKPSKYIGVSGSLVYGWRWKEDA